MQKLFQQECISHILIIVYNHVLLCTCRSAVPEDKTPDQILFPQRWSDTAQIPEKGKENTFKHISKRVCPPVLLRRFRVTRGNSQ